MSLIFSKIAKCKKFMPRPAKGFQFKLNSTKVKISKLAKAKSGAGHVNVSEKMNAHLKERLEKAKDEALKQVEGQIKGQLEGAGKTAVESLKAMGGSRKEERERPDVKFIPFITPENHKAGDVHKYGRFAIVEEESEVNENEFPLGFTIDTIKKKYWKAFTTYDDNNDGVGESQGIDFEEFKSIMKSLGTNKKSRQLRETFSDIDIDGNGSVDFSEFLTLMYITQDQELTDEGEKEIISNFHTLWRSERDFVYDGYVPVPTFNLRELTWEKKNGAQGTQGGDATVVVDPRTSANVQLEPGDILRVGKSPENNCDVHRKLVNVEFWEGRIMIVTEILDPDVESKTNDTVKFSKFSFTIQEEAFEESQDKDKTVFQWTHAIAHDSKNLNREEAQSKRKPKEKNKDLKGQLMQRDTVRRRRSSIKITKIAPAKKSQHAKKGSSPPVETHWPLILQSRWEAKGLEASIKRRIKRDNQNKTQKVTISRKSFQRIMRMHGQAYNKDESSEMMENIGWHDEDKVRISLQDFMAVFFMSKSDHHEYEKERRRAREKSELSKLPLMEQIARLQAKVEELQAQLKSRGGIGGKRGLSRSWSLVVPKVVALSTANRAMETFARSHTSLQKQLTIKKRRSTQRLEHRLLTRRNSMPSAIRTARAFNSKSSKLSSQAPAALEDDTDAEEEGAARKVWAAFLEKQKGSDTADIFRKLKPKNKKNKLIGFFR
jgi:Ca2+-binding EF-hand superfamily protein